MPTMTTPFPTAYDEATTGLRRLRILAHVIGPSMTLDSAERADLAVLLEHPELRSRPFGDAGTRRADIVAALLAPRALSIGDRDWLCDGLLHLLTEVAQAVDTMAACVRHQEGPDAAPGA